MNKKKIFNDPLYGLIMFQHEILYRIIDHPYFQRLRRISQQALSHYVYPGAMHTRFQHALGATHLMSRALEVIKSKGHTITELESEAACIAVLLHDVGHGPYSHALEHTIIDIHHEEISLWLIELIGEDLEYDMSLALQIFKGSYNRPFFHHLVSGQIDVDRMDYLTRDSYFSGVAEGIIGYDRIIAMMNVKDESLVIEEKGLYSIEKFLMARRLMYWQVYLHKTVVSAEVMLISTLKRAKYLLRSGIDLYCSHALMILLKKDWHIDNKTDIREFLDYFVLVDDIDVMHLIKESTNQEDKVMRKLCSNLLVRKLFKLSLRDKDYSENDLKKLRSTYANENNFTVDELSYFFVDKEEIFNYYSIGFKDILILKKDGIVVGFDKCVDTPHLSQKEVVALSFRPQ
jgi:uncharacterized protein